MRSPAGRQSSEATHIQELLSLPTNAMVNLLRTERFVMIDAR
jgi:hypothetical protein